FIDWQLEVGVPGLIVLGTTGEFLSLTDDERTQVVETAIRHVGGRVPVLIGTMNAHTPNAVRYSREAEELGADGLMMLPPYYVPRASSRIWDYLVEGRIDDAKRVQRLINQMDHTIAAGHPTYGHQCYSKALAAAAGYPVGDVRPPLTQFASLEGEERDRIDTL